jgi:hypothetical protein
MSLALSPSVFTPQYALVFSSRKLRIGSGKPSGLRSRPPLPMVLERVRLRTRLSMQFLGSWPGNLRELRNALEGALVLASGHPRIEPEHLPRGTEGCARYASWTGGG